MSALCVCVCVRIFISHSEKGNKQTIIHIRSHDCCLIAKLLSHYWLPKHILLVNVRMLLCIAHATHFLGFVLSSLRKMRNLMLEQKKKRTSEREHSHTDWDKANQVQTLHNPVCYVAWMCLIPGISPHKLATENASSPSLHLAGIIFCRHLMHTMLLRFARIHSHIHHINNIIENEMKIEYRSFWYEKIHSTRLNGGYGYESAEKECANEKVHHIFR